MSQVILDEKLITRIAAKDMDAFRELYEKTSETVYGFAFSILKNSYDAEDVMHDAYVRIYTGASGYTSRGKPLAWILTIVKNLSYSRIRQGKVCEKTEMSREYGSVKDISEDADDRMILEKAMQILDPEERQIIVLHAMTQLKHREISEILGMPIGTVMSKYSRALKKMRNELEKTEDCVCAAGNYQKSNREEEGKNNERRGISDDGK